MAVETAPVDTTEHQGLPPDLQVLQPAETVANPDVTFGYRLEGAASLPEGVLQHGLGRSAHGGEPFVCQINVGLFSRDIRMGHNEGNIHFACSGGRAQAISADDRMSN